MKKIVFVTCLLVSGSLNAQHQKGEWFVTAGTGVPLRNIFLMNPYVQSGFFLTPRFALGLQYQHTGRGDYFQRDSYGVFARYYFMNSENAGIYGYGHFLRSHTSSSLPYVEGISTELNFGIGSSIRLSENWRFNMEVNLFEGGNFSNSAKMGISYTIPYRKKTIKSPL